MVTGGSDFRWTDIDRVIDAIERIRAPLDQTNREERVIRAGYVGIHVYDRFLC